MIRGSQFTVRHFEREQRQKDIRRAMLFGGFSGFSMLYCVQPLLPMLASHFTLTAAQSSWVLSVSTFCLAFSLLLSGVLSELIGRNALMVWAVTIAATTTGLCGFVQSFEQLIFLRGLLGIALGGLPAVAIAYITEEVESEGLASTIGLYIAGSALGGMSGRLLNAFFSDYFSWKVAFFLMGSIGLYTAWEFARALPEARSFKFHRAKLRDKFVTVARGFCEHALNRDLLRLFGLAFILTGCFTSFYNYIGFHLVAAPFHFSQANLGCISIFYLFGMLSSVIASSSIVRFGRRWLVLYALSGMVLGMLFTLSASAEITLAGTALFTFSFFAAHSVASTWVAHFALSARAIASAMYLFCYYAGSSLLGVVGGDVWSRYGWRGLILSSIVLLIIGALLAILSPPDTRNVAHARRLEET